MVSMVFRISAEFHVSDVSGYNFMSIALSSIEYLVDLVYVQTRGFQTFEGMIYNYHAFLAKLAMLSYAFTVPMPSTARISEHELSIARRYLGSAGSGGWARRAQQPRLEPACLCGHARRPTTMKNQAP
jgi:hypothetical protein